MNNYYNLYVESVYSLAETISVKFEDAAHALNLGVILKHGIDSVSTDPFSWKYYQNISGAYHFSDTRMIIVSLDTLHEIEFSMANLAMHPATKEAYQFGKRYYRELVQRYPGQESLILGILYPSDITIAVESKDGTILNYPKNLVDSNEYTFIEKLQKWIYNYVGRWINKQYAISDDLYIATYLGQFYLHLIPTIINIRLQACKTNEAHSFHIQQYLASHGMLDRYIETMTKEQCLFFYRNILYIERNSGKRDTFDWLVDNLMTKRSLPLYEYTMKHDVSKMLPSLQNGYSLNYYPEITFRKNPVNFINNEAAKEFLSLSQVKNKLNHTVSGNLEYQKENSDFIKHTLEDSKSNIVATKLLESSLVDYTQSTPELFTNTLLYHWAYWCSLNKYNAFVSVTLPKSKKVIELGVKDAFILLIYTLNRSVGINLNILPDFLTLNVLQDPIPNISVLRNCTQRKYVSDELITQLYNTVPSIVAVGSVNLFYNQCKAVYNSQQQQYYIQCNTEHPTTYGELNMASAKLYADVKVKLHPTELIYSTWLDNLGISFYDYNDSEFNDFSLDLISIATGLVNNKSVSLKQIQKSMIEMLALLSSYSIQIISDISQPNVNSVPGVSIRIGDIAQTEETHTYLDENRFDILNSHGKEYNNIQFDLGKIYPVRVSDSKDKSVNKIDISINVISDNAKIDLKPVKLKTANFSVLDIATVIPTPTPGGKFRGKNITNVLFNISPMNHAFQTENIGLIPMVLDSNYNTLNTSVITNIPFDLLNVYNSFYFNSITSIPFALDSNYNTFSTNNNVNMSFNLDSNYNTFSINNIANVPYAIDSINNSFSTELVSTLPFILNGNYNTFYTGNITNVLFNISSMNNTFYTENINLIPISLDSNYNTFSTNVIANTTFTIGGSTPYFKVIQTIPINLNNGINVLKSTTVINLPIALNSGKDLFSTTTVNVPLSLNTGTNGLSSPIVNNVPISLLNV